MLSFRYLLLVSIATLLVGGVATQASTTENDPTQTNTGTDAQTSAPTSISSPSPTELATGTEAPTPAPTELATGTEAPTPAPTELAAGTEAPTPAPTELAAGTEAPTPAPTMIETEAPVSAAPTSPPIQPRITTLKSHPSRRSSNILAFPEGSPWCRGNPTIWIPGHQNTLVDTPHCLIDGQWQEPNWAQLDINDDLNSKDDPYVIDRHACGAIDATDDGILDLYCLVGANRGMGVGFNEVYKTRKNGSLTKKKRHGLQKFQYTRTRHTVVLNGLNGTQHVFISASYGRREDGRYNKHAMFLKNGLKRPARKRFFSHVRGDWQRHTNATCALSVDINQDGLDDLVLCNAKLAAFLYVQKTDGSFKRLRHVEIPSLLLNWRNARVADFDGDSIPDLAVVHISENSSFLRIFKGISEEPYFDFTKRFGYYSRALPYAAPDLEAFDANGDGVMDLYIVQSNERRVPNNYCGGVFRDQDWYTGGPSRIMPPANYTPPPDSAPDLLLLGNPNATFHQRFQTTPLNHAEPGCGYFVKKFTDRSLVLAQGGFVRPGHQLLLEWN